MIPPRLHPRDSDWDRIIPTPSIKHGHQFSTADPDRHYSLEIYNLKGQRIKTLMRKLPAGNHSLIWNGKDANGQDVASGVYLYRLSDGSHSQSRKMLMMK